MKSEVKIVEISKLTLKQARNLAELTQSEASEKIGVSIYTLLNWEKGKTSPKVKMWDKIAEVYGIPKDMIVFVGGE